MQAAAGIGKETAFAFAEAGVKGVAFVDLNEQGAQDAAEESKQYATNAEYQSLVIHVDVADEAAVQLMVDQVVVKFGRIDYAVNSAGVSGLVQFLSVPTRPVTHIVLNFAAGQYFWGHNSAPEARRVHPDSRRQYQGSGPLRPCH